ncbi:nuclear transport factor 2 family protein [Sphingopyxis flava]|uniref:SnoaL-like domain-containing protein n=1 Tax=Sphingopyxis flava TaxID=1507287 RepID=A0A1T5FYC4_9SPHN|nr:nuclear transport factor 2 family protein [Sphingopyxis flava]SKC01149.1 SnoaL-like domain-containing protein [Sphingopyxis flava]
MTLEERISRLEDIEEIRSLRNKFHHFINEGLAHRFGEVYTDDAVVHFDDFMKQEGLANIIAASTELARQAFVIQFLHNHAIELDGDRANGFCYLDARYAANGESLIVAARYDDEYRRTPAGWRICKTRVNIFFSVPLAQGWADAAASEVGKSYFTSLAEEMSAAAARKQN